MGKLFEKFAGAEDTGENASAENDEGVSDDPCAEPLPRDLHDCEQWAKYPLSIRRTISPSKLRTFAPLRVTSRGSVASTMIISTALNTIAGR